jgi:hypothetical protein
MYTFYLFLTDLGEWETFIGIITGAVLHIFRGAGIKERAGTTHWVGVNKPIPIVSAYWAVLFHILYTHKHYDESNYNGSSNPSALLSVIHLYSVDIFFIIRIQDDISRTHKRTTWKHTTNRVGY